MSEIVKGGLDLLSRCQYPESKKHLPGVGGVSSSSCGDGDGRGLEARRVIRSKKAQFKEIVDVAVGLKKV